jgi:TP901 family phage tail tape measure protein
LGKDGQVDLAKLGDQLNRVELLTLRLGNDLPGTTQDFVEMATALRQGGLAAETILGGAGEAVADLAVVTNQLPRSLAKDFAQYGMQFNLQSQEYIKAADLFARIYARSDLGSAELIEGSKYFQLRAGAPLGLKGLEGAETAARLMASLKKIGLEGSVAGTGSANFFSAIATRKKELAELKKTTGVDLQFFDKQGRWVGIEKTIEQMEKLRKLSPEKQMAALKKIAGDEGAAVGTAFIKMGVQGWREFNETLDRTVGLEDAIATKTDTFNAKMDSLLGTVENLTVSGFTPMLNTLKPVVDLTNKGVGALQEFAKENPNIASVATHLFGVGSASLVVVGGFKAMRAAWALWKITSAIGAGETAFLSFLRTAQVQSVATGTAMQSAAMQSSLSQIFGGKAVVVGAAGTAAGSTFLSRFTLAIGRVAPIAAAVGVWSMVIQSALTNSDNEAVAAAAGDKIGEILAERFKQRISGKLSPEVQRELERSTSPGLASEIVKQQGLDTGGRAFWQPGAKSEFVKLLEDSAKARGDAARGASVPDYLLASRRSAIAQIYNSGIMNATDLAEYLKQAYETLRKSGAPALYSELERLAKSEAFPGLEAELDRIRNAQAGQAVEDFTSALRNATGQMSSLISAIPYRPGMNSGPVRKSEFNLTPFGVPSRASGGHVEREGMVLVHRGEDIVPAKVTRGYRPKEARETQASRSSGETHLHFHIPPGSPVTQDPKSLMAYVTYEVTRQRERR